MNYFGKASVLGALLLAGAGMCAAQCDKTQRPISTGSSLRVSKADNDVVLGWQGVQDAEWYNVYKDISPDGSFNPLLVDASVATTWTDSGAIGNGNTLHEYKVVAANCYGESAEIWDTFYRSWKRTPEQPEFAVRMGKEYLIRLESVNNNSIPGYCADICGHPESNTPRETCSGPPNPGVSGCYVFPPALDIAGLRVLNTSTSDGLMEIYAIADADGTAQMWNSDCHPGMPPCSWVDRSCPVQDNAGCAAIAVYELK